MKRNRLVGGALAALALAALIPVATAVGDSDILDRDVQAVEIGNSFTYQGRLTDGGSPANGTYDLRFILYDAADGGAQVGTTVTREDVTVANGLFTVDLDFGASAFNGDARWMEIAVRPGASSNAHTVLSPRQTVSPAPYALYAKAAGGFAVPLSASGTSEGAPASTTGLLTVTQDGTGIAIAGNRTSTEAASYPAVLGTNAGGGAGVQGESTYTSGVGVQGFATGETGVGGYFSGPTGAKAVSSTAAGTALEIDGPVKVSGSNPTAFVHIATAGSISDSDCEGNCTQLNNPLINGNPNAILIVTQVYQSSTNVYNDSPIGVWYDTSAERWNIFNQSESAPMPENAAFNVLVILR